MLVLHLCWCCTCASAAPANILTQRLFQRRARRSLRKSAEHATPPLLARTSADARSKSANLTPLSVRLDDDDDDDDDDVDDDDDDDDDDDIDWY